MKLAFYKASKGRLLDKAINLWTGLYGYSHVEIIFSNGEAFSSSPREGHTRFKNIKFSNNKWEIIDLDIPKEKEEQIYLIAKKLEGKRYDWKGIFLHQFIGRIIGWITGDYSIDKFQDKNKWWCSEITSFLLGLHNYRIHPNKMAKKFNVKRQE